MLVMLAPLGPQLLMLMMLVMLAPLDRELLRHGPADARDA